jgi:hypothetical protein
VIALPPSLTGAVKLTLICPLPAVAVPMVGATGYGRDGQFHDRITKCAKRIGHSKLDRISPR